MNSVTTIFPMVFLLVLWTRPLHVLSPERRTGGGEIDTARDLALHAASKTQERPDALPPRSRMGAAAQLRARSCRRLHVDVRGRADRRDQAPGLQALLDAGLPASGQRRTGLHLRRQG